MFYRSGSYKKKLLKYAVLTFRFLFYFDQNVKIMKSKGNKLLFLLILYIMNILLKKLTLKWLIFFLIGVDSKSMLFWSPLVRCPAFTVSSSSPEYDFKVNYKSQKISVGKGENKRKKSLFCYKRRL